LLDRTSAHQLGLPLEADILAYGGSLSQVVAFIKKIWKIRVSQSKFKLDLPPGIALVSYIFKLNAAVVKQVAALGAKTTDVPVAKGWLRVEV